jgi:TolB-like protein/Tfp pilus assembly protein PilF
MQDRRLAAIMFTDIVGYTSLMGQDEDRAFEILRKNRQIQKELIEKHGGEWLKEMGDGILASFSTSSDAVRCAGEIQSAAKKVNIPLRIGIHEGEVVFEGSDVFGDGVNVASRLEEVADEGSIHVSDSVYKDIKNKSGIKAEFLEEKVLKNVEDPVKIYGVTYKIEEDYKASSKILQKKEGASIAVLPFMNMSNDPEQEYFCDGMTEEIINALTHVESLKVIARTSSFAFKDQQVDIRSIGRKLDVEMLLEGSVRRAGNRLRITSQLIRVSDGTHIWSERYDRELEDVFEIQDEISLAIVNKLKVQLYESEKKKILKNQTENLEAYKYYLKGRYEWNKRTIGGFNESIQLFEKAIFEDPNYVLAYTGLADTYVALSDWGEMLPGEGLPKARGFLQKALEIDDSTAEIYFSFMYLNANEWNLSEFRKNAQKAIDLNPNFSLIYHIYGLIEALLGNFDVAIKHNKRARELDPISLIFNFAYGLILYFSREFDPALRQFQKTLFIDKTFMPAILWSMYIYLQKNMHLEAIREFQKILNLDQESAKYIPIIDEIYEKSGLEGFLKWIIDHGLKYYKRIYNHPYHKAICHALLNEKDKAYEYLDQTYELRSLRLLFIKIAPDMDNLRADPRFQMLLDEIGIW